MSVRQQIANWREDFIERHGGSDVCVNIKGTCYFPDGARCGWEPIGQVYEPPEDETERTKLILTYWNEKLRRAEDSHKQLHDMVNGTFIDRDSYVGPLFMGLQEDAEDQLDESKRIVLSTRRKVVRFQKELDELLGTAEQQEEDREYEQRRQKRQDRLHKKLMDARV